ncbi:unnamed protein product [Rotaria magnacalcarata]|nr:unnamed protein product [Rotaria magnacalcarata]CAF1684572.1 unnamed protein product [Rotaria magnacalcarata]
MEAIQVAPNERDFSDDGLEDNSILNRNQRIKRTRDLTVVLKKSHLIMLMKLKNELKISDQGTLSRSREQALSFALDGVVTDDLVYVLFEINADLELDSKPFADVTHLSAIRTEDEILFVLGTTFRIRHVTFDSNENLWIIRLELCNKNESDLNSIFEYYKNRFDEKTSIWHLTDLLFDMNELERAEKLYKRLINEVSEYEAAICYDALGVIAHQKADNDQALTYHNRALQYFKTIFSDDHPVLGYTYEHIGSVHTSLGNYDLALENHEQTFAIWLSVFGEEHTKTTQCLINMGLVYDKKKDFSKALSYYFYALEIYQKTNLLNDHPLFGLLFNNIGYIYFEQDNYREALGYYQKSLQIRLKTLSSAHVDIAVTYHNMASLYFNNRNYKQAMEYFEKADEICKCSYDSTHPLVAMLRNDILKCTVLSVSKLFSTILETK